VVNFTPWPLYSRVKSPRYPLDRRLGGPQSRSGRFGEEKILDSSGSGETNTRFEVLWICSNGNDVLYMVLEFRGSQLPVGVVSVQLSIVT
jgi:hypothetical protein